MNHLTRSIFTLALAVAPLTGCAALMGQAAKEAPSAPVALTPEEAGVLAETNKLRAENHLPPLQADAKLVAIARARSRDMAKRNYLDTLTPEGRSVFTIMRDNKVVFGAAGENIAKKKVAATTIAPRAIVDDWAKTPAQRVNLLHDAYDRVGVGAVRTSDGQVYVTQILAD